MDYFFRLEAWWLLGLTIPLLIVALFAHYKLRRTLYYRYSLGQQLASEKLASHHPYKKLFYFIRLAILVALAFAIAKPQMVDSRSNIIIDGIDIMVVLDASGSMQLQDYGDTKHSRFDVAKKEAIRFIEKRTNDAIGLVLFGKDALSRCPLTMDKKIVRQMIDTLQIGDIDPNGTVLATGMITGINRLKQSKAKSKIMILLTDGEPSAEDMDPGAAIEIAKTLGIKIYTIGIGSDQDDVILHPMYGPIVKPKVNAALLKQIARATNGRFFMAHNARDMRSIYDTIDRLEKTKHEAPLYSRYYDIFTPIVLGIILLLLIQQLLATFVWFGL